MKFFYFFCYFGYVTFISLIKTSGNEIKKNEESSFSKNLFTTNAVVDEREITTSNNFLDRTKLFFRKVIANDSMNQCKQENCEFCCLSLNFCGSKEQCENSKYTLNILRIIFFVVCLIIFSFLIYKIYITDSRPKQEDYEKIDDKSLNILIGLFIQNKENRRKMKM